MSVHKSYSAFLYCDFCGDRSMDLMSYRDFGPRRARSEMKKRGWRVVCGPWADGFVIPMRADICPSCLKEKKHLKFRKAEK